MSAKAREPRSSELWRYLPRAPLYPLHTQSILVIAFGSITLWVLSASLFSLLIMVVLGTGMVQFLLLNLRHSAYGANEPPLLATNDFLQFHTTPFKLLLVSVVWTSLVLQLKLLSPHGAYLLAGVGLALLPAFTTLLVLEDSIKYALDPGRLLRFAWRGHVLYVVLAFIAAALLLRAFKAISEIVMSEEFAASLVFSLPRPVTLAWLLAGFYLAVLIAHVLGRIAFHAHDFRPPPEAMAPEPVRDDFNAAESIARRLAELLRSENQPALLHEWRKTASADHEFQARLLQELMKMRVWVLVPMQAQRTVGLKLAARKPLEALMTAMDVMNDFASFTTDTPDQWLSLCQAARETGRGEWLGILATKGSERFPQHPILLDIALLRAQHFSSRNDIGSALDVLEPHLGDRNHPRNEELQRTHRALQALLER